MPTSAEDVLGLLDLSDAIDVPVVLDEHGNGVQAGLDGATFDYPAADLVTGVIAGRQVGCLSAERQLVFHTGYPPSDKDRADVAALVRRFGMPLPEECDG